MARLVTLLLLLGCLLGIPAEAYAQSPDVDAVLRKIQERVATIETISSSFTQTKHLSMFDGDLVSTGKFLFGKPDRLRWEYLTPMVSGFALDGKKGLSWEGTTGTRKEFSLRSDPIMGVVAKQLLAWASFDLEQLSQQYSIELAGDAPTALKLTPKSNVVRNFLTDLVIEFSQSEDTLKQIELHEKGGDFTRIIFENTVVNGPISAKLFR